MRASLAMGRFSGDWRRGRTTSEGSDPPLGLSGQKPPLLPRRPAGTQGPGSAPPESGALCFTTVVPVGDRKPPAPA